jgi:glycerol kinase
MRDPRRPGNTVPTGQERAPVAISEQSAELLGAMQKDASCPVAEVRADGGAARNDLLIQF